MQIELDKEKLDELRKTKLLIGTPMYGGNCHGSFTEGMISTIAKLTHLGIPCDVRFIYNESLIQRARNYLIADFYEDGNNYTHFLFIDADIGFNADQVLTMLYLQSQKDNEYDILTAPYPKKSISWEKIQHAVKMGVSDENPEILQRFVGDYVINLPPNVETIDLSKPVEVMEAGTGFMMFSKETLLKIIRQFPETKYTPDHPRSKGFDGSRDIYAIFDCKIDENGRYLSEDYLFCKRAQQTGLKVYTCPWISLKHTGTYTFGGSMIDVLSIGAALTASKDVIKNNTKEK